MAPRQARILRALLVFINSMYKEMFRAVRVFRLTGGNEETEEKEYLLNHTRKDKNFGGNGTSRVLTLYGFDISEQHTGIENGVWKCVYIFDSHRTQPPLVDYSDEWVPISKKCRLIFQDLGDDVHAMSKLDQNAETSKSEQNLVTEVCSSKSSSDHRSGMMTTNIRFLDLNSIPDSDAEEDMHKKRRAAPEDIARIALEDLVKYFDLPITEASKSLKIGLTVLKKKCREFGIPRWPHRKIKSLDRLISNLQEEMQQQNDDNEDEATTIEVSKKKRMIEFEKERIEKKPYMDIQEETKKFRQDIFKRRYKARVMERESGRRNLNLP